jgi:prepilin-type processing-associated H-X9-DG protein
VLRFRALLTVVLACAAPAAGIATMVWSPSEARADARDGEREIAVGTELMATADVTLHKAEIAKGSRVSVTKVLRHGNVIDGVNVALADGHVVKMSLAQVHSYFRVVAE